MNERVENVITLEDSLLQAVVKMAEGNPGAASVMCELLKTDAGAACLFHLDDMQIRGWKIWYAYKNFCGEDLEKFSECIVSRDPMMIKFIEEYATKVD